MFDYQAGEKYKLTLIMVGVAGLIAGMFFTLLLLPSPEMSHSRRGPRDPRMEHAMHDPDITGGRSAPGSGGGSTLRQLEEQRDFESAHTVDKTQAEQFMQGWLPLVWDLGAQTAGPNQSEAIKWMTPDCATAYKQNVWSSDMASKVASSSLQSRWSTRSLQVTDSLQDGSVVVKVQGTQMLQAPTGTKQRDVNFEYLLKKTPEGIRVAGISEGRTQ